MKNSQNTILKVLEYLVATLLLMLIISVVLVTVTIVSLLSEETKELEQEPPIKQKIEQTIVKDKQEPISRGLDKPRTQEEIIDSYADEIATSYEVDPALIKSIIWHESRYNPNATNGNCLGLMQVSTKWHWARASKLGVTDFYDSYGNILLGTDYISELFDLYQDPRLVLMMYNMKTETAMRLYKEGRTSDYAKSVLSRAETLR